MDPVSSHSCHLLQQLHEQRIQGLLCDCMLVVKGVCFKAHKNVLAAFSQYFRSLFQNSPSQKNEIFNLEIKNVGGIGQILDFMYTSHLDLNPDNVHAMLDIAQCLQVQIVLNMCHTFLKPATAVESASTSTSSTFPLLGASVIDADCILGDNSSTHSLQDCAPHKQTQASEVLDGTRCDKLHNSFGNVQKQSSDRTESTELTSHHYKLRNFYSKQYKQNHNTKQDIQAGQPVALIECAEPNPVDNHSCTVSGSESVSEAADALPSNCFRVSSNDYSADRDLESTGLQSTKMMRLKKAVHLKKLNILRSQEAADLLLPEPEADEPRIRVVIETANTVHMDDSTDQTSKEKEADNPIVLNSSEQSVETERCQSISELEDHSQPPLLQRHYACDLCGKNFKHPSNLELHRRSHTGEKPFECIICGKRFSQAGNLQTHVRRHSGEKPYICEICGKRFAASGDVQRHIVIHTGEKPHLCDTCGRGFSNFSNLKEHKKTHTADKVFTCDECGKSFNMHRKLIKHGIRHTGERPYICSTCGKRFGGSGDLCRHLRTHTGERPYSCETCNKCFSRSAVLRRHKRMHCKTSENSPNALEEFSQPMEISDQEGSLKSEDSFTQDISVTLLPVSVKVPEDSRNEFDRNSTGLYCKMQSMIEHSVATEQEKLSSNYIKISKPILQQSSPPQSYDYEQVEVQSSEEPLQSHSISMVRSSMVTLNNHCNDPSSNRATSMGYRNSEGPFFSSMTLWGLAMKTLHNENENELDQ